MRPRFGCRALALVLGLVLTVMVNGQPPPPGGPGDNPKGGKAGVSLNDARAFKGYTLIAPMNSTKAHLIDMEGRVVHTWECDSTPALSTYLLDNGNLLRPAAMGRGGLGAPGAGGRIQEFSWDGKLLWDFTFEGKSQHPHHDITRLPNGNVLMIIADRKSREEAVAAGRRGDTAQSGLSADAIIEVKPTGKTTGAIVWEWHAWDHLIQDHDKTKDNYGRVSAHPERIDVNYGQGMFTRMAAKKDDLDKLQGLGYLGGPGAAMGRFNPSSDWTHINSVDYNADLDQVLLSVHAFSEIWIIDHGTTTKEAAAKTGGKYGKGGDLLYRWGNPQAYRSGTNVDQRLFQQHNAHWIPQGLPGAGNILVFNNGGRRPDGSYSSVDEIVPPVNKSGTYERKAGLAFGPTRAAWSYVSPGKSDFFAPLISGAHRLANGNTLICSGPDSTLFEVTPEKEAVWRLVSPQKGGFGGGPFPFMPPQPGEIMPRFLQQQLRFTAEQETQLEALQKEVDARLAKIMTEDQRDQLKKMREGFAGRFAAPGGGFARPGGGPVPGGPGPGGPGPGGPGPGGPGPGGRGPGGMGMGPGGPGGLFRSYRYGLDHPAFQGKKLTPGKLLAEL